MMAYQNFSVTHDAGVTTVSLDVPGRPLNVLTVEVMSELEQIVHDLETRSFENPGAIKAVVFQSSKESGFLAGADVLTLANIASATQATHLIEDGQTLFQRIQWLPMPTVAVIHGPCLGGGLEWALACDHRVARDNSSTRIGLPEIKLGLIPGWGGTQRLPRLVGLRHALRMILTGKPLSGSEAVAIGLVDRAIPPCDWESGLPAFVNEVLHGNVQRSPAAQRPWWQRWVEATRLGRAMTFRASEQKIKSKIAHYPALAAALRAVRQSYGIGKEGFLTERNEFVDLLATPTCRHLLNLFFSRERARALGTWSPQSNARDRLPIQKIGVVGGGAMGAGIGQLAATKGYEVAIKEIDSEAAQKAQHRIEKGVHQQGLRKGWGKKERSRVLDKVTLGIDDHLLHDCDLVIEAVVEREEVKEQVLGTLDRTVKDSAILASNTSSLSVTRMASATRRPGQVAGLHFFNPVHRMELVEVVRTELTDDPTVARLVALVKALGKTPLVTSDSPGFLVNRVLFPYLGEAILMVIQGHDPGRIDQQIRRFGMPMGPLELLDQVGIDVAMHVSASLGSVLPGLGPVVDQLSLMVENGQLGKRSGQGFYHYAKGRRKGVANFQNVELNMSSEMAMSLSQLGLACLGDGLTAIERRLIYPMLHEAVRCLDESVVQEAWAIDLGLVLGVGFAPHRGGPLHVIDRMGLPTLVANSQRLAQYFGNRFSPPDTLIEMSKTGETFFGKGEIAVSTAMHERPMPPMTQPGETHEC